MAEPRLLVFAYACEPDKGSEPGAGWAWVRALAHLGEITVITRENNRQAIERGLESVPKRDRLAFEYVDLPGWARGWKKGQRGVRLYYVLWMIAAFRRGRALQDQKTFDLVWHLTLANAWLGSLAPLLGRPFVYGPVGTGAPLVWRLLPSFGLRGGIYELARQAMIAFARLGNPLARLAWSRADVVLVQNPDTLRWLPARHRSKAVIFPNVALDGHEFVDLCRTNGSRGVALFAGRLVEFKGPTLAVEAIAHAPDWRLLICGTGPQEGRVRRLIEKHGIEDRVELLGHQTRADLLRLMTEKADTFLFPSIHDQAPWVVGEALLAGLPVLCLDSGGPPVIAGEAGVAVDPRATPREVARRLAEEGLPAVRTIPAATAAERGRAFLIESQVARVEALLAERGLMPR